MRLNFKTLLVVLTAILSTVVAKKSALKSASTMTKPAVVANAVKPAPSEIPKQLKLIIGAGGIYAAFLYYGTLQEDVFDYKSSAGLKFKEAWFLQAVGNDLTTPVSFFFKITFNNDAFIFEHL